MKTFLLSCLFSLLLFPHIPTAFAIEDPAQVTPSAQEKEINEQFRTTSKNQIDQVLNDLKPDNAPDIFPSTFKEGVKSDKETGGIPLLLSLIAGVIASIASLVALINILQNAYAYISSKGDTGKTGKAIKGITWSLIGLIGIIFSYNIVTSVINLILEQTQNGLR